MHEIITIQLGHRANYLATHFWNTQESYFTYDTTQAPSPIDHDVHFRPGLGLRGEETFTPRTLIYDLKSAFGSMRKGAGLYDEVDDAMSQEVQNGVWDRTIVRHEEAPVPISEYQRGLDQGLECRSNLTTSSVRYWSDFNRVFYHPRSVVQINDLVLGSSLMPFDTWVNGQELFDEMNRDFDLLDKDLRVWAEECDRMQGIQLFGSCDDAWGGFAAQYVERIKDEFGKTALWVWAIEGGHDERLKARQALRRVNAAKSIHNISAQTTMYIPLCAPLFQLPSYIRLDPSSQWHLSALLSMAVETMTLPSRRRLDYDRRGLDILESCLNVTGNQQIAGLQCSVSQPSAVEPQDDPADHRIHRRFPASSIGGRGLDEDSRILRDVSYDMNFLGATGQGSRERIFGCVESLRGHSPLGEPTDGDDASLSARKRRRLEFRRLEKHHTSLEFPLLDSFPDILCQVNSVSRTVAVQSSLSTSTRISSRIKALQQVINRIVDVEEREGLSSGLGDIREAYEEGWASGSDDDMDD